ncbi:MAG TPA: LCP family protein [Solirubrobacteraceae bacterium]|jgi:LCP family protein required for cell wall assembly
MPDEAPRKRWLRSWTRFLTGGLLIVALSGGATTVLAWHKLNTISKEIFPTKDKIHTEKGLITASYSGAPETFLLIGSDKRAGSKNLEERESPPRSDTMLLVRLDPRQGQTSVLSIPRDLLVKIVTPGGEELYPEKMNAAYSIGSEEHTKDGGAKLVAKTIENLLHIKLNGIIDVTFKGFIKVVDALGCVYINVDHRYWHTSGLGEEDYSSIHLFPGYQKLCYEKALSYVRYRHTDSDFVRVARQQEFIRQLREQVSLGNLVDQIDHISKEVGKAVLTTFNSGGSELIKLTKLIAFSQRKPLRQVKFRFNSDTTFVEEQEYVTAGPQEIRETVNDFLHGDERVTLPSAPKPQKPRKNKHRRAHRAGSPPPAAIGLYPTSSTARDEIVKMAVNVPFPVVYPALQTGPAIPLEHHRFKVKTRQGTIQHGFIEVFEENSQGGYYDVEGMTWNDPPLIDNPSQTENIGKRHYIFIDDGAHIHVIAWHEHKDIYWVNNTLLEELTNAQMIYIAQSARPLR